MYLESLRTLNIILGLLALVLLLELKARRKWKTWAVPRKLWFISGWTLILTFTYGTFEVLYLDTFFRVPMATASLAWAILAATWPDDRTTFWPRKR